MQIPSEPQPDQPVSARWGADVVRCLRAFRLVSSADLTVTTLADGTSVRARAAAAGGGGGLPWSKLPFGYSISGTVVTIYPGEIQYRTDEPVVTLESDRTISADYSYVAVEYNYSTRAALIGSPTTTKPVSTSGSPSIFRKWLWLFRRQEGVVTRERIGNLGNIHLE